MQKLITFLIQLCLIFSVQALSGEQRSKVATIGSQCLAETKADIVLVAKGETGDFVDDPQLKAFVYCFLKLSDIVNEEGYPKPDVIKEKLSKDVSPDTVTKVLEKCEPTASTPHERAAEFYKCYWLNSDVHIKLF